MPPVSLRRTTARLPILIGSALALAAANAGFSSEDAASTPAAPARDVALLDTLVISATRTPQPLRATSSSVTVLSMANLAAAQIVDLRGALAQAPGVHVANSGVAGGQSAIFIRGAASHQSLFIIDGLRINDKTVQYQAFLGGIDVVGLERIEVLRGPQSTLYGSTGLGGIIVLDTAHTGETPYTGKFSASVGSFDTYIASAAARGRQGRLGYSASVSHAQSDHDRPSNAFEQWSGSARLEYALTSSLDLGLTYRGYTGEYEEPGSNRPFSNFPGLADAITNLVSAYATWTPTATFTSKLTGGWHQNEFDWTDTSGSPFPSDYGNLSTRRILDWQNTWRPSREVELIAGLNHERLTHSDSGALRYRDELSAAYATAVVKPSENLTLNAGLRHDDFDSVGDATTGRIGAAWYVPASQTTLRASYGHGFSAPSVADRFGDAYNFANPDIKPEKSRGWDAGIEQQLGTNRLIASLTYFHNKFTDAIGWQLLDPITYQGRSENIDRAESRGFEFALVARPHDRVRIRGSYTNLDMDDISNPSVNSGWRLNRPRHTADAEITAQLTGVWFAGTGAHFTGKRTTYGPAELPGFVTCRLFTHYRVSENLLIKARVENLTDKEYEEVAGYPALPRAVYGSIEWQF